MNFLNNYFDFISIGKNTIKFFNFNLKFESISPELTLYIRLCVAITNITVITLLILLILNFIFNIFFDIHSKPSKWFKFFNTIIILFLLILLCFKFFLTLKIEQSIAIYLLDIKNNFYNNNNDLAYFEFFTIFSSAFSDAILILSFITGIICIELLGYKNLFKNINNLTIFYLFIFIVTIMVNTNNLLIMFLSFEFIFLPTIYFAYKLGYSKKIDKTIEFLFYWTLFGSFLVLAVLAYIYNKYNSLNYFYLSQQSFTILETRLIFCLILIGFGIKIPIAPFHSWLLKVHVEAPTAFSIFLSGFLVKSSLYCLFMFISIFSSNDYYFIFTGWIFYSLIIATLGLAKQSDIKRLIAWATVQEMTFMLLFIIFKQLFLTHVCILFVLLHGLLSTYMFYIVDILQRRFKTRAVQFIKGLHLTLPKLTKYIWFLIFLFSGFPLTAKFFIEWSLISLVVETNYLILIYIILFINFLGTIFFCRIMFILIFGTPEINDPLIEDTEFVETQKKEYSILNLLIFLILLLTLFIFIL